MVNENYTTSRASSGRSCMHIPCLSRNGIATLLLEIFFQLLIGSRAFLSRVSEICRWTNTCSSCFVGQMEDHFGRVCNLELKEQFFQGTGHPVLYHSLWAHASVWDHQSQMQSSSYSEWHHRIVTEKPGDMITRAGWQKNDWRNRVVMIWHYSVILYSTLFIYLFLVEFIL